MSVIYLLALAALYPQPPKPSGSGIFHCWKSGTHDNQQKKAKTFDIFFSNGKYALFPIIRLGKTVGVPKWNAAEVNCILSWGIECSQQVEPISSQLL